MKRAIKISALILAALAIPGKAYAIGFTTAAAIGGSLAAAGGGLTAAGIAVGAGITAGVVGLGAYGINRMTQQPKMDTPSAPAAVKQAEPSVAKAEADAAAQIKKKRVSMARNRTIYTGPLGLSDSAKSDTTLKTLTGV